MIDIPSLLEEGTLSDYERKNRRFKARNQKMRVSNAGGCARATLLELRNAERRPLDPTGARIFMLGTQRGEALEQALREAAINSEGRFVAMAQRPTFVSLGRDWNDDEIAKIEALIKEQGQGEDHSPLGVDEDNEVYITGSPDMTLIGDEEVVVLDFKTMKEWPFKKVNAEDFESIGEPYLVQLALYAHSVAETHTRGKVRAALVFECKNTSELKVVEFTLAQLLPYCEIGVENLRKILRAYCNDTDIERPHQPNEKGMLPWQCNYCAVCQTCWKDRGWTDTSNDRIPKGRVTVSPAG